MTHYWIEDLGDSVENFSESGNLLEYLRGYTISIQLEPPMRPAGQNIQRGCFSSVKAAGRCAGATGISPKRTPEPSPISTFRPRIYDEPALQAHPE
jgi:hypothetical protein